MVRFMSYTKHVLWSIHPKAGSNSFMLDKGRLAIKSLKRVSCCASDRPREGNKGAQQVIGWHMDQSLPV